MRPFIALAALLCLPALAAGPLNDTGQTGCYDGSVLTACSTGNSGDAASWPRQDARFGRDAASAAGQLSKLGAGAAGFDFTALDANGNPVAPGSHACVRDNATGLVWSGETFPASGAGAATAAAGYARCGLTVGWRLPTRRELLSIVHNGASAPAIDGDYFPATLAAAYWSGGAYGPNASQAWYVNFNDGSTGHDDQGTTLAVRLVTNDINHAPSFTKGPDQTVLEDAGAQTVTGWATAMDDGDGVEQALHFIVSNDNHALFAVQPAVAADGTLTYTPAADANGSATVTVQLADDGGTANGGSDTSASQTFTIHVTPVNDAPRITLGGNYVIDKFAKPGPITLAGWATGIAAGPADEAGQQLTATLSLLDVTDQKAMEFDVEPALDPATGTLSFTIKHTIRDGHVVIGSEMSREWFSAAGLARVEVTLKDNGGSADGGNDTTSAGVFSLFLDPVPVALDVSVRHPWRSFGAPVVLNAWDTDSDFRLPDGFDYGVTPWPWLQVRLASLPQNGFVDFAHSSIYDSTAYEMTSVPAALVAPDGTQTSRGNNFQVPFLYVPFQSTFTGLDTFTYYVYDANGNVSNIGTVSIEIFQN